MYWNVFIYEILLTVQKPPGQKPPDNKPPRIIEKIIAKYAVDANLFRLGSTNPKKFPPHGCFLVGGEAPPTKNIFFLKNIEKFLRKKISIYFLVRDFAQSPSPSPQKK